MRSTMLAAAILLSAALPAAAQPATAPSDAAQPAPAAGPASEGLPGMDQLMKYVAKPEYFTVVSTLALNGEHDLTPDCKAKALGRSGLTVLTLPLFEAGKEAPVFGRWKDQVLVDRCGSQVVHNVLVEAAADGLHVGLLMPGETGAPVAMQPGVVQDVARVILKSSGCKDPNTFVVLDTRKDKLLAPMNADDQGRLIAGKWDEVWTTRACGKVHAVLVTFAADGKGSATYSAKPTVAKPKPPVAKPK